MAVGTPSGRTLSVSVTSLGPNLNVTTNHAAVSTTSIIQAIGLNFFAPELSVVGVKYPTAAGASGATTDAFITWKCTGPAGAVYTAQISMQEVATA